MSAPHDTADLLKTWLRGWAASRAVAPPVADGAGWRVEVGAADQVRRHVFVGDCERLRELGAAVHEPWVWLKACLPTAQMRALLPPRWIVRTEPSYFMHFSGPAPSARLPAGYRLLVQEEGGVHVATLLADDGMAAASGRVVMDGDSAIFDRIRTDVAHQRRGLGRALMGALHERAGELGAARGLLAATPDGHALYTTIGWTVQAPYASGVIEAA